MNIEAMKLALEALKKHAELGLLAGATITALRQAIEQAEQAQPVAWRELCRRLYVELFHCDQQMTSGPRPKWQQGKSVRDALADAKAALENTAPPPRPAAEGEDKLKPLTDEEIEFIRVDEEFNEWGISEAAFKYVARAIEAAHGIKENT
jgi:hypothetical protein